MRSYRLRRRQLHHIVAVEVYAQRVDLAVPDFHRPRVQVLVRAAVRKTAAAVRLNHDEISARRNGVDEYLRVAGPKQCADRSQEVVHDSARAAVDAGSRYAAHLGLPGRLRMQHAPHSLEIASTERS